MTLKVATSTRKWFTSRLRSRICRLIYVLRTSSTSATWTSSACSTNSAFSAGRPAAISVTTHNGTHVDAPWHYASTTDGGKRAMTIDEMPLDWFLRPGVKLDFRPMESGHVVTARELEEACRTIDYQLKPFDIVLMNTSAGDAYGSDSYLGSGCGFGREATLWLLDRGIKVVGTDAWSWDAPFSYTRKRFATERDPSIIWEGHKAGREGAYCQIDEDAR